MQHNEGIILIQPDSDYEKQFHRKKYFRIYENYFICKADCYGQNVTIWQKDNVVYQLECNGKMIYTLEQSNNRVWLSFIWDLIRYYFSVLCFMTFNYFYVVRMGRGEANF